jgi:hypothetical protein
VQGGKARADDPSKAALERADPALTKRIAWGEGFIAVPARKGLSLPVDDTFTRRAAPFLTMYFALGWGGSARGL